jgi:16S rRNA (cytidine1402-2'-O)-methyltransferase
VKNYGKLYLMPVPISEENGTTHIPHHNLELARNIKYFIVEDAKTARRFLKIFAYPSIEQAELSLLNEHSKSENLSDLLAPLLAGNNVALMSDAGCPGIADPGADLIRMAHRKGIEVLPLVGPSAIVLSIMASGFNSQNFAFVGYLPIDKNHKVKKLKELESLSAKQKQAQFFIETPYRNNQLFELLLNSLAPATSVFIGKDILSAGQLLKSATVAEWKKEQSLDLNKIPVVFGIYA